MRSSLCVRSTWRPQLAFTGTPGGVEGAPGLLHGRCSAPGLLCKSCYRRGGHPEVAPVEACCESSACYLRAYGCGAVSEREAALQYAESLLPAMVSVGAGMRRR